MLAADFNGDGNEDLDIIESTIAFQFGQPYIFFGAGNGTFTGPFALATGPALAGDVNNDGHSDLVVQSDGSIVAMLGQSNGTFSQVTTTLPHPGGGIAALGDLNHDGKLDILVFESPFLRVWFGNGDGTFTEGNLVGSQGMAAQLVLIADLDGDGNADFVVVAPVNSSYPTLYLSIFYGNGDGTFQPPVSLPISHQYTQLVIADVNQDNKPDLVLSDGAGIAVIENQGGRTFGSEQHFVAGQGISGLSVVDVNGDGFPDIVAANAGGTTVAVLLNQPNGNPINGAPSQGVFTISPQPSQYGQPVTLSITMSAASGPAPTGSVSFSVDGSFIATTSLTSAKATYTFRGLLETGNHIFVATYDGDTTYAPESFSALQLITPPVYATTTVLVATPSVVYTSQTVRLTATVSSSVAVSAGTVTFMDGNNTLGVQRLYQGPSVLLDTNLLSAGTHSLTAVYYGYHDPYDEQAIYQPSTSAPVTVTVNSTATATSLSASPTSATAGAVVMLSASVTSNSGVPFGAATFYDGTAPLGTSSLQADGSCIYSTASLSAGTHTITVAYNANATFAGSTSSPVSVTITSAAAILSPTFVALTATKSGNDSEIVARVSRMSGSVYGAVTFLDDGKVLGSAAMNSSGIASLTVPPFAGGSHRLYASFAGAPQLAPSVTPELLEQFPAAGPGFSLSVAANSANIARSGSQPVLLTVLPVAGFHQPIQLSCVSGLPAGYACSFSPASLSGGSSTLQIQPLSSAASARRRHAPLYSSILGFVAFLVVGVVAQRRIPVLLLIAVCAGFMSMTGCGNPSVSAGQPQMMVLSIQAAAGSGENQIIHSAQMLILVQPLE